jgi:hypothetical protein
MIAIAIWGMTGLLAVAKCYLFFSVTSKASGVNSVPLWKPLQKGWFSD